MEDQLDTNNTNGSWVEPDEDTRSEAEREAEAAAEEFKQAANKLCECSDKCGNKNFTLSDYNVGSGSGFLELEDEYALKSCRVECAEEFMGLAKTYLAILFVVLLVVQLVTANRAWRFMHDESDKKAEADGTIPLPETGT